MRIACFLSVAFVFAVVGGGCRTATPDEVALPAAKDVGSGVLDVTLGTDAVVIADNVDPSDAVTPAGDATAAADADAAGTDVQTQDIPPVPFSKAALLQTSALCAMERYEAFANASTALTVACQAWATAPQSLPARLAAQQAFHVAMDEWQLAEGFRFGPMNSSTMPGGMDLRDQIDAWPLFSRCKVEENLVAQAYAKPGFGDSLVNGRTLTALEYLLFYPGHDHACSQFSPVNGKNGWATLTPEQLTERKSLYAVAAATDVAARAAALVAAWSPTGGNYLQTHTTAGKGSALFASEQAALNTMSDALFFLDKELKDWKIGKPVGMGDCVKDTCPEAVESPYAGRSVRNALLNLQSFGLLYAGCGPGDKGVGFDDWLLAVGAAALAAEMSADLATAVQIATATPDPLEVTLASNLAQVQTLYAAIKALNDDLKTTFVSVLNLDLPKTVEGDND